MNTAATASATTEILDELARLGWRAELCCVPVPVMTSQVVCGQPKELGDESIDDYYLIPRSLVGPHARIAIYAEGESMLEAGIAPGDRLEVELCDRATARDGDIVLATVDGLNTVKELYTDEEGDIWLLPYNPDYEAIRIEEGMQLRVFGRVVGVTRRPQRSSARERAAKIRKASAARRKRISTARLEAAIVEMGPLVEHARQWYAVMRALVDASAIEQGDYTGFVDMVCRLLPHHTHLPVGSELRRMAVQSFARQVSLWDSSNAPVSGQRFDDYLRIARATQAAL